MGPREDLIEVLRLTRKALQHPENDFAWSSWEDATAAVAEVDTFIEALTVGKPFDQLDLEVLFAATGPICEVSLSSGWSDSYLRLSERFDAALEQFTATAA